MLLIILQNCVFNKRGNNEIYCLKLKIYIFFNFQAFLRNCNGESPYFLRNSRENANWFR